jgi:AraC family ethanolamine operon transcriptional activator
MREVADGRRRAAAVGPQGTASCEIDVREPSNPGALPVGEAAVWQCIVHTDDVDAHARAQPGWTLHYEQLSPGAFAGLVHHVQLPHVRLVHERCSVALRQRGRLSEGSYGFALALDAGAAGEPTIFNGQRVEHDAVMLGRNDELDLRTPAGYALAAVVVDAELLVPLWQGLYGRPPSAWMESQLVVPARPALAGALRALHLETMAAAGVLLAGASQAAGDDAAARQLRDALLIEWFEVLPESVDASALPSALARKRLVDRACEIILSHPDEPLSMLEVCRRVAASRRKLNYCFREVLGTSPVKYLRAVRLNGVRRELRAGACSVQDVAARWGFWHAGQFSRDYRRQFGETPSHTLKKGATGAR